MSDHGSDLLSMLDDDDPQGDDADMADLEKYAEGASAYATRARPQSAHPSHRIPSLETAAHGGDADLQGGGVGTTSARLSGLAEHEDDVGTRTLKPRPQSAVPLSALPPGRYQRLYGSAVSGHTRPRSCVPTTPSAIAHSARAIRLRSATAGSKPDSGRALLPHEQAVTAAAVRGSAGFSDAAAAPLGTAPKPRPYSAKLLSQRVATDAQAAARMTRLNIAAENVAAGRRGMLPKQTPSAPAEPARADVGIQAAPVAWTRYFFNDEQIQRALGARTAAGAGASASAPGGVGGPWLYMHLDVRLRAPHDRHRNVVAPVSMVSGDGAQPAPSASFAPSTTDGDAPSFGAHVYGEALRSMQVPTSLQDDWDRLHFASLECHVGDTPTAGGWPHASGSKRARAALDHGGGPVAVAGVGYDDVRSSSYPEGAFVKASPVARRDVVQLAEYAARLWPRGREDSLALIELLGGLVTTLTTGLRGADDAAQKVKNAAVRHVESEWRRRADRMVRDAEAAKDVYYAKVMADKEAAFAKERQELREEIKKMQRHSEYAAEDQRRELAAIEQARDRAERALTSEKAKVDRLTGEREELRERVAEMRREETMMRREVGLLQRHVDPDELEKIQNKLYGGSGGASSGGSAAPAAAAAAPPPAQDDTVIGEDVAEDELPSTEEELAALEAKASAGLLLTDEELERMRDLQAAEPPSAEEELAALEAKASAGMLLTDEELERMRDLQAAEPPSTEEELAALEAKASAGMLLTDEELERMRDLQAAEPPSAEEELAALEAKASAGLLLTDEELERMRDLQAAEPPSTEEELAALEAKASAGMLLTDEELERMRDLQAAEPPSTEEELAALEAKASAGMLLTDEELERMRDLQAAEPPSTEEELAALEAKASAGMLLTDEELERMRILREIRRVVQE
ncbi:hypothetical protein RI054_10g51150 [Pseudoscourfieldia marina]